jgi:hypothetical protein
MVFAIIARLRVRGKGIAMVVEWAASKNRDRAKGTVVVMDMVTSTGMVAEIRMHLPLNLRNPTTSNQRTQVNRKAKIFITYMGVLAFILFYKCLRE